MDPFLQYYQQQARSGVGTVFTPKQRGHGIGNFFGSIFRTVVPYLKSGFSAIKDELLKGGIGLLSDAVHQVPIKQSLGNRMRDFGNNLTDRAVNKVTSMSGSGGIRKRAAPSRRQSSAKRPRVRRSAKSRRKVSKKRKSKRPTKKRTSRKGKKRVQRKKDIFDP